MPAIKDIRPKIKITGDGNPQETKVFAMLDDGREVEITRAIRAIRYEHNAGELPVVFLEIPWPALDGVLAAAAFEFVEAEWKKQQPPLPKADPDGRRADVFAADPNKGLSYYCANGNCRRCERARGKDFQCKDCQCSCHQKIGGTDGVEQGNH